MPAPFRFTVAELAAVMMFVPAVVTLSAGSTMPSASASDSGDGVPPSSAKVAAAALTHRVACVSSSPSPQWHAAPRMRRV